MVAAGRTRRHPIAVPDDLPARVGRGDPRAVARMISLVEEGDPRAPELLASLNTPPRPVHIVGLTGPPGVGKSTLTNALVAEYRAGGARVGVLAIDPSSTHTGGALLGDRVRMQDHALDPAVYLRSMASRGRLGGLAWTTPQAVRVLEAAGCDVVFIETVGVGQNEIDIASLAATTLVILAPGTGDSVQAAKAGVLEVGDIYVVNKADVDGATRLQRELTSMMKLGHRESTWRPPICLVTARTGEGVPALANHVSEHQEWLPSQSEQARTRLDRTRRDVQATAIARVNAAWRDPALADVLKRLLDDVAAGRISDTQATSRFLRMLADQV